MLTLKQAKEQILEIFNRAKAKTNKVLKHKEYKELADILFERTKFLNKAGFNVALTTKIYCFLNDITSEEDERFPHCQYKPCGKVLWRNIKNLKEGFVVKFCCPSHGQLAPETKKKMELTNIRKYNVKHTFQSENNKQKSKITMNKRYGCDYAQQNKTIKEKTYNTMIKRYGVKVTTQSKELIKKIDRKAKERTYDLFLNDPGSIPLFSKEYFLNLNCEVKDMEKNQLQFDWKCKKCGKHFKSPLNRSWKSQGINKSIARCLNCYPYRPPTSKEELEMYNFIKLYEKNNVLTNDRNVISPLEIDIFIPSKNLAIEFDGLYWHSDINGNCNKYYHLHKTEECEKKGIQLIHIFEDEWLYKQDIVKSRLKNLLGIYNNKCFARQCEVKEVPSKESFDFQEANHIQGAVNSKVNLGLCFKDELVSLMTFSKPRFDKKHEWELVRFCNKLGWHIPGAASKLLTHFEREYKPKNIVSYADRRWSEGNLYKQLGFELDHISQPDYWYTKIGNEILRESRIKYQKHKLQKILPKFDSKKTEKENMLLNGYSHIWDCGNFVFIKT